MRYFSNLKLLIENISNGCPVTLIGHSMGGLVSHHFLVNKVDQKWKDKYIKHYVTLASVWGGATSVLRAIMSGTQDQIFRFAKPVMLRQDQRSFPSFYWLLPKMNDKIWSKTQVIVTTPTKNYTIFDIHELVKDLNYEDGIEKYSGVMKVSSQDLAPPNVPTHCMYGSDVDTELSFNYGNGDFPDNQPAISKSKGDGTVNIQSLEACRVWAEQQSNEVHLYPLNQTDHMEIVRKSFVMDIIKKLVFN